MIYRFLGYNIILLILINDKNIIIIIKLIKISYYKLIKIDINIFKQAKIILNIII